MRPLLVVLLALLAIVALVLNITERSAEDKAPNRAVMTIDEQLERLHDDNQMLINEIRELRKALESRR